MTAQSSNNIRLRREKECFPIINRSWMWHARLTNEQQLELARWYQNWLDAPATGIIPITPAWINDKTKPEEILI